jgi:tetratricopeptide (TPR) repeat protein
VVACHEKLAMMDAPPRKFWAGAIVLVALAGAVRAQEKASGLAGARQLFFEGKYAEAEEAFARLASDEPVSAALGVARCREAVGQRGKADEALRVASEKDGRSAPLVAERARVALARGDTAAAEQLAHAALGLDQDQTLALWISGQVAAEQGKLDEAKAHAERLVKQYNDEKKLDPDELRYVGLAAAELARWNRQSEQFRFLVNDFYPDLLKAESLFWPAHYEAGVLFAEKYNFAEATREFKAALALNPNAAEVHAALGRLALEEFELATAASRCERALEINPECLAAWHLKADIHLASATSRRWGDWQLRMPRPMARPTWTKAAASASSPPRSSSAIHTAGNFLWPLATRSTACAVGRRPPGSMNKRSSACRSSRRRVDSGGWCSCDWAKSSAHSKF